jgi:hypothetical protein
VNTDTVEQVFKTLETETTALLETEVRSVEYVDNWL